MSIAKKSTQITVLGNEFDQLDEFETNEINGKLDFFVDLSITNPSNTNVYLSWIFEWQNNRYFNGHFTFFYLKQKVGYTEKHFFKGSIKSGDRMSFCIGTTDEVKRLYVDEYAFKYKFTMTPTSKKWSNRDLVALENRFTPTHLTDTVLVVNEKKFHVNKMFLSFHSEFFHKLFTSEFKEKSMAEIPIENVEYEDFACFLLSIYPIPEPPTDENAEKLLELADRFMMPAVAHQVEQHLLTKTDMRFSKMLILADKYKMKKLEQELINRIECLDDVKIINCTPDYDSFSHELKAKVLDRLMKRC